MIKSILVIFFAVIAFLMFIVAIAKKHQSHNSKSIFYVSVIISAIGGFILYGCSYAELMDNMILAIVFTMLSTLNMFLFSNDFSDIAAAAIMQYNYIIILFWILHVLALYATANAIFTTLGIPLLIAIQSFLGRFRHQITIIYGIHEESLALGRELQQNGKSLLIFIDRDATGNERNELLDMGGLYFLKSQAVHSETGFLKGIGIQPKKKISVYAVSTKEEENYSYALELKKALEALQIPSEHTALTMFGNMEMPYGKKLQSYQEEYGFGSVLIVDRAYLSAKTLVENYPPCNYIIFDTKQAKAMPDESFHAVIVGFGNIGQAILKKLVIQGQFENAGFRVTVFDPNYKKSTGYLQKSLAAMLNHYDIRFVAANGKSEEFYEYLEQNQNDIDYIAVCCGNQKMNNEITVEVESILRQQGAGTDVFRCSYEEIVYQHMDENGEFIYRAHEIFTLKNLDVAAFDYNAMQLNHIYCQGQTMVKDWNQAGIEDRMSSRASADFSPAFLKMTGYTKQDILERNVWNRLSDTQLENLARTEHKRWCAFYYSMGYRKMPQEVFEKRCEKYRKEKNEKGSSRIKIQKDISERYHTCLVEWDELDALTKEYRTVTGDMKKDYKQDDRNNVLMVPKIL